MGGRELLAFQWSYCLKLKYPARFSALIQNNTEFFIFKIYLIYYLNNIFKNIKVF